MLDNIRQFQDLQVPAVAGGLGDIVIGKDDAEEELDDEPGTAGRNEESGEGEKAEVKDCIEG